jgi:putative oligomerization/nucleic acid binding protein
MFRARRIMRRRAIAGAAKRRPSRSPDLQKPEAPPAPDLMDPAEQLRELSELREQGILSEEEFAAEKKKLLGR